MNPKPKLTLWQEESLFLGNNNHTLENQKMLNHKSMLNERYINKYPLSDLIGKKRWGEAGIELMVRGYKLSKKPLLALTSLLVVFVFIDNNKVLHKSTEPLAPSTERIKGTLVLENDFEFKILKQGHPPIELGDQSIVYARDRVQIVWKSKAPVYLWLASVDNTKQWSYHFGNQDLMALPLTGC